MPFLLCVRRNAAALAACFPILNQSNGSGAPMAIHGLFETGHAARNKWCSELVCTTGSGLYSCMAGKTVHSVLGGISGFLADAWLRISPRLATVSVACPSSRNRLGGVMFASAGPGGGSRRVRRGRVAPAVQQPVASSSRLEGIEAAPRSPPSAARRQSMAGRRAGIILRRRPVTSQVPRCPPTGASLCPTRQSRCRRHG